MYEFFGQKMKLPRPSLSGKKEKYLLYCQEETRYQTGFSKQQFPRLGITSSNTFEIVKILQDMVELPLKQQERNEFSFINS